GRPPAFFESSAAVRPQTSAPNFEPNPPPMTSVSTVTLETGILKAPASSLAVTWTAWVLAQATILSEPSHFAVSPWGSRQTWVMTGSEYVVSIVASALAIAPSGSPLVCDRPLRTLPPL